LSEFTKLFRAFHIFHYRILYFLEKETLKDYFSKIIKVNFELIVTTQCPRKENYFKVLWLLLWFDFHRWTPIDVCSTKINLVGLKPFLFFFVSKISP